MWRRITPRLTTGIEFFWYFLSHLYWFVPLISQELVRAQNESQQYVLPDGQKLQIGIERFTCAETLFNPFQQTGLEVNGLHEMIWEAVNKCEMDVRKVRELACKAKANKLFSKSKVVIFNHRISLKILSSVVEQHCFRVCRRGLTWSSRSFATNWPMWT
jgi:hypothetical protein